MFSYISNWNIATLVYYSLLCYQHKDPLVALKVLLLPARIFFQELVSFVFHPLTLLIVRLQKIQRPRGPRRPVRKLAKLALPALIAIQLLNLSEPQQVKDIPTLPAPTQYTSLISSSLSLSLTMPMPTPTPTIVKGPTDVSVYDRPMGMVVYSPRIDFLLPSAAPTSDIPAARPTALSTTQTPSRSRSRFVSTLMAIQIVDHLTFVDRCPRTYFLFTSKIQELKEQRSQTHIHHHHFFHRQHTLPHTLTQAISRTHRIHPNIINIGPSFIFRNHNHIRPQQPRILPSQQITRTHWRSSTIMNQLSISQRRPTPYQPSLPPTSISTGEKQLSRHARKSRIATHRQSVDLVNINPALFASITAATAATHDHNHINCCREEVEPTFTHSKYHKSSTERESQVPQPIHLRISTAAPSIIHNPIQVPHRRDPRIRRRPWARSHGQAGEYDPHLKRNPFNSAARTVHPSIIPGVALRMLTLTTFALQRQSQASPSRISTAGRPLRCRPRRRNGLDPPQGRTDQAPSNESNIITNIIELLVQDICNKDKVDTETVQLEDFFSLFRTPSLPTPISSRRSKRPIDLFANSALKNLRTDLPLRLPGPSQQHSSLGHRSLCHHLHRPQQQQKSGTGQTRTASVSSSSSSPAPRSATPKSHHQDGSQWAQTPSLPSPPLLQVPFPSSVVTFFGHAHTLGAGPVQAQHPDRTEETPLLAHVHIIPIRIQHRRILFRRLVRPDRSGRST
ncbi:hypothetical protein A4X13_0g5879 [Tilletia indica]|uniref:Uncharacterized protein n=1 Tax=Tilletia indica TaxID=43049 RepID=A0A177TKZ8_9BASI|nr:hypothetical protein A4X13_0g5879 [Tilletia indica]